MRNITPEFHRIFMRGAALIVMGSVAAGCSSGVSRFKASDFVDTGNSGAATVASTSYDQPYPGDSYETAGLDRTSTGSITRRSQGPRPSARVGASMQQKPLPAPTSTQPASLIRQSPARAAVQRSPIAPPVPPVQAQQIASAAPQLDRMSTGSLARPAQSTVSNARTTPVSSERRSGWNNAGGTAITVREGETVYNLSRRFGVPAKAILSANGLSDASQLKAGTQIVIPTYVYSRNAPVSSPDNEQRTANVQKPVPQVPQQPERPNQVAVLPDVPKPRARPERAETGTPVAAPASAGGIYTVVSGDTLYGIARKTGVGVEQIKAANGLSDGHLRVGQKLAIPAAGAPVVTQAAKVEKAVDQTVTSATPRAPVNTENTAAKKPSETQLASVANSTDLAASAPDSTGIGKLRWPARGMVVAPFGSNSGAGRNDGIDIAVPAGTPVKAAENGVVIYAGDGLKEFGNTVLVRHDDGMVTVYGHASALKVERGQKVRRGQEIALSGMSGNAERPKLHFEVRKNATPVDPTQYLE